MKTFNWIFIVYFLLAAVLQYNDPDPYLWIPMYLYAAFLCWQAIKNRYRPFLFWLGIVVYALFAVYLLLDANGVLSWINQHESESLVQSMKAEKPWIEESREFFGLLIIIVVLVIDMIWLRRRRTAS